MIAAFLIALSLPPMHVPADAELVYPVMPKVTPFGNADGEKAILRMSIHSARASLNEDTAAYASLSLFKNTTDVAGEAQLQVSFESYRHGFGAEIPVKALWSDEIVLPVRIEVLGAEPSRYVLTYKVPVDKAATHSLRLEFVLPLGVSGVDREERLIGYKLADIGQAVAVEQFRMSVQYDPDTVFVPIAAKPDLGWEVGANGAFLKMAGRVSDKAELLSYRYYPAGFARIGWGG